MGQLLALFTARQPVGEGTGKTVTPDYSGFAWDPAVPFKHQHEDGREHEHETLAGGDHEHRRVEKGRYATSGGVVG